MTNVTGDLLSAASLVVTALTFTYASWNEAIDESLNLTKPTFRADREPEIRQLRQALRSKSLPLMTAAVVFTMILGPIAFQVTWEAVSSGRGRDYDTVKASYVAVWCLCAGLAAGSLKSAIDLAARLQGFKRDDSPQSPPNSRD